MLRKRGRPTGGGCVLLDFRAAFICSNSPLFQNAARIAFGAGRGSGGMRVFTRGVFRGLRVPCPELSSGLANDQPSPFFFSATTQATGKDFSVNGSHTLDSTRGCTIPRPIFGMPITGETKITDLTRGGFGQAGTRNSVKEAEKCSVAPTSKSLLYNDHFLAL